MKTEAHQERTGGIRARSFKGNGKGCLLHRLEDQCRRRRRLSGPPPLEESSSPSATQAVLHRTVAATQQSLTVAPLQAHEQPPDPMQTSEPYFPEMPTMSQSLGLRVPRSAVIVQPGFGFRGAQGCFGGRGLAHAEMRKLLPHQKASYWEQTLDPLEHMLDRCGGRVRNQANLLLETHDGTPDPVLKKALSGVQSKLSWCNKAELLSAAGSKKWVNRTSRTTSTTSSTLNVRGRQVTFTNSIIL